MLPFLLRISRVLIVVVLLLPAPLLVLFLVGIPSASPLFPLSPKTGDQKHRPTRTTSQSFISVLTCGQRPAVSRHPPGKPSRAGNQTQPDPYFCQSRVKAHLVPGNLHRPLIDPVFHCLLRWAPAKPRQNLRPRTCIVVHHLKSTSPLLYPESIFELPLKIHHTLTIRSHTDDGTSRTLCWTKIDGGIGPIVQLITSHSYHQ